MTLPHWHQEAISKQHDRKGFDCGQPPLNEFLLKYARQAHLSGASKTYVAVSDAEPAHILGYYTLSPAQLDFELAPEAARPAGGGRHPIGGFRLGRLAVSTPLQGKGLGGQLLVAAAQRCLHVAEQVGGSVLLIDAKDHAAARWYKTYGALEIPGLPLSLVLPYSVFSAALAKKT